MKLPRRLEALREKNFRRFFVGHATSLLGTGMVGVALSFAVLDLTGSVSDLGFVLAAQTVPLVLFLLVGGAAHQRARRALALARAPVPRWDGNGIFPAGGDGADAAGRPAGAPPGSERAAVARRVGREHRRPGARGSSRR